MRAAIGGWPDPCNYLICKRLFDNAIATGGSLVAIQTQCR